MTSMPPVIPPFVQRKDRQRNRSSTAGSEDVTEGAAAEGRSARHQRREAERRRRDHQEAAAAAAAAAAATAHSRHDRHTAAPTTAARAAPASRDGRKQSAYAWLQVHPTHLVHIACSEMPAKQASIV